MNKLSLVKIAPYVLMAGLTISGCGEKSECELPSRHVHKYVKQFDNGIKIEKYMDKETLDYFGYHWTDDYIEITKDDEKVFKVIENKKLFEAENNWEYLYHKMASNHDYLEFYYEYEEKIEHKTKDKDGNEKVEIEIRYHNGWTTNPYYEHNTGRTRLCHHRYSGYRIINKNGKFKAEESKAVDDIREVINEYPYFNENCETIVSEEFWYSRLELPYLKPEDFNVFEGPDLYNKELTTDKTKVKSIKY